MVRGADAGCGGGLLGGIWSAFAERTEEGLRPEEDRRGPRS